MLSGISMWQLLILLVIVILVFGSKKIRTLGSDLGSALKGFRSAMGEEEQNQNQANSTQQDDPKVVDQAGQGQQSQGEPQQHTQQNQNSSQTSGRNE